MYNYDSYDSCWDFASGYTDWYDGGSMDMMDGGAAAAQWAGEYSFGESYNEGVNSAWQEYASPESLNQPGYTLQSWTSENAATGDWITGQTWYNAAGESVASSFAYTTETGIEFRMVDGDGNILRQEQVAF